MTAPAPAPAPAPEAFARSIRRLGLLLVSGLAACALPEPPETFAFPTNHDPAAAMSCATRRLRVEGFEVAAPADSVAPTVALRRVEAGSGVGERVWWRLELSTTRDEEGRTVVQSVAGTAPELGGPWVEPSTALQGVIGRVSAACTW